MTRDRMALVGVLIAGLAVRVAWGLLQPTDPQSLQRLPDQVGYLELAENLLQGRGLTYFEPRFNENVKAMRLPGYPVFLALCGASPTAARVAQAFIDTSTILGVYLLARRWLSPWRGVFSAMVVAVNPFLVYFSGLLLTETLFIAILIWGMVLLARRREYVWGGLVLALSIAVRPSAALIPLTLGVTAVFANRQRDTAYQRWWPLPVGTTMLVLTLLVLTPWALRNRLVLGQWVWTTTNDGLTLYDGFNPDATGASDQGFTESMPYLKYPGMEEVERSRYLSQLAWQFIWENPGRSAELTVAKIRRTWSPVPLSDEYGRNYLYVAAGLLYAVPLFGLTIAGLLWGRLPVSAKVFLALPALYLTAAHAVSVGSLRYRIPAEPPMAAIAAAVAWKKSAERRATSDE